MRKGRRIPSVFNFVPESLIPAKTWSAASSDCDSRSYNLFTPHTDDDLQKFWSYVRDYSSEDFWLGAATAGNVWLFSDDKTVDFFRLFPDTCKIYTLSNSHSVQSVIRVCYPVMELEEAVEEEEMTRGLGTGGLRWYCRRQFTKDRPTDGHRIPPVIPPAMETSGHIGGLTVAEIITIPAAVEKEWEQTAPWL